MSAPNAAPAAAPAAPPAKKGKKLVFIVVCLVFAAGGAAVPMVVDVKSMLGKSEGEGGKKKGHAEAKQVAVPFGDAVVNLAEERMTRYLRLKIVLMVDAEHEKEATERLTEKKAPMKSWLISHLAGKTLKDVSGTVGVNRLQREILERFEDILYPDGEGYLKGVLFEEFVVQ